jgi:hypothetical protein
MMEVNQEMSSKSFFSFQIYITNQVTAVKMIFTGILLKLPENQPKVT